VVKGLCLRGLFLCQDKLSAIVYRCGDNIYKPLVDNPQTNDDFQQLQSMHSQGKGPIEDPKSKKHDLNGKNVLISHKFHYFGSKPIDLPDTLVELKVGRAHKSRFSQETISTFVEFISRQSAGVDAPPSSWPQNDDSWKTELI